jgi:outer membrane protein assembly factor BamB
MTVVLALLEACTHSVPPVPAFPPSPTAPTASSAPEPRNFTNWPEPLFDAGHSSYASSARAITPANIKSLSRIWRWRPDTRPRAAAPQLVASPTVFGGKVYIGATTGDFYAIDELTGVVLWKRFLGPAPAGVCTAPGINSTASVVAQGGKAVVFTGGADGKLYALDGDTGAVKWKASVVKSPGQVLSSPTLIGRFVYIGVSDMCHEPSVRGGVKAFNGDTGKLVRTYWTVPSTSVGGSVRVGVAASPNGKVIFAPTAFTHGGIGDSFGMVALKAGTLEVRDVWKAGFVAVSRDHYFRTPPITFSATVGGKKVHFVGSCNRDGQFYAFSQSDVAVGPAWATRIPTAGSGNRTCLGGAVWDSQRGRLLIAGGKTRVGGKVVAGAVRRLNPATGAILWERVLAGPAWGSPSANGNGVIAVPNRGLNVPIRSGLFLLDERNGKLLASLKTDKGAVLAQAVFADQFLFVATLGKGLMAFSPSS